MNKKQYLAGGASLAVCCFTPTMPVWAQTTSASQDSQVEEIVVTAQKREEKLQTVPIAVTVFSATQIERSQQRDITDLTGSVANFEVDQSTAGPNSANISLRGLSFQDIEKSFEPPVGVVVDGIYLSTSTGQLAQTFDFQQIEVAAGPQGTLFGKNTTGGVVNITRSKPNPDADDPSGKLRMTFGNFGRNDYEGVFLAPVIPGKVAIKVAVFSQNDDGYFRNTFLNINQGRKAYEAGTVGIDFQPTDKSDIYLIYDKTNDHSQLPPKISALTAQALPLKVGGIVDGKDIPCFNASLPGICTNNPFNPPSNVTTQNVVDVGTYDLNALTLNASYDFDLFKLISVTGYRYSTEVAGTDYDVTQYNLYYSNRAQSYHQFSEEGRFESSFDGPFNFVAGAYYFNSGYSLQSEKMLDLAVVSAAIPIGTSYSWPGQYTHQSSQSEAVFAQGTYDIIDDLRLILGARESWDQKQILYSLYTEAPGNVSTLGTYNPGSGTALSDSWVQFTPKVGLEYHLTPDFMTYFTYSKGYNSGGFNGRAGTKYVLGPYAPETLQAYEVGVKTDWFDHRLRVNADLFKMDYKNKQLDIIVAIPVTPFNSTTVTNAAGEEIQGAELSVTAVPVTGWSLSTNVGYLDAKYVNFNAALLTGTPVTNNDNLIPRRSPPFTVGFTSDYHFTAGPGEVGVNFALKYVDQQELDLLNDPRGHVPPTTKVDASVRYDMTWRGFDWELSGFVKNITNATPINAFVTGYRGSFVEFWGQDVGRTYGVSLQAKF